MTLRDRYGTIVAGLLLLFTAAAVADDWPTYRHDNRRSGVTPERLPVAKLGVRWVWRSALPPQSAWGGPAKWDAYHKVRGIESNRDYDEVFHTVATGGKVYFASTADNTVRCLEATSGKVIWTFTADAPIRAAPTVAGGRVYFGSDDGWAYCVSAQDGRELWRYQPVFDDRQIPNNGNFISRWPCRTGVLVEGPTAYCGFSLLPWKASYLVALDATSGEPTGKGRYVQLLGGQTMEGCLLAWQNCLVSTAGRAAPIHFDRATGQYQGSVWGNSGGSFATITEEGLLFHAPGQRGNATFVTRLVDRAKVSKPINGILGHLQAGKQTIQWGKGHVQSDGPTKWRVSFHRPREAVLAGKTLFVGGPHTVAAFNAADGKEVWRSRVEGRAGGLTVAGGRLYVSTDLGLVYCFAAGGRRVATQPARTRPQPGAGKAEKPKPLPMTVTPSLRFTGPDTARVTWTTPKPLPTVLVYWGPGGQARFEDKTPKTEHVATMTGLARNVTYKYRIEAVMGGRSYAAGDYDCDTYMNYAAWPLPKRKSPYPDDKAGARYAKAAERILKTTGLRQGICLVVGSGKGQLAYELATRSGLRVVGLETDSQLVAASRKALLAAGVYGRVDVRLVKSFERLPFVGDVANLIVCGRPLGPEGQAEMDRLLKPVTGVWLTGQAGEVVRKVPPAGGGVWTHQYGLPAGGAYGGESLLEARANIELALQWMGRPGARNQVDRQPRGPAPLAVNGRLFSQGFRRIIAQDAHNGVILWSLEAPFFERYNMPRDTGNWCADDDFIYAVVADQCWKIDAATGGVVKRFNVLTGPKKDWSWHWGYIARNGELLYGSSIKAGSDFKQYWTHHAWYDGLSGWVTEKVCSDNLFAVDPTSGKTIWTYQKGLIVNSTVCIGDGRIYFVESRNPKAVAFPKRRLNTPEFWADQHIVALNAETGKVVWEIPRKTAPGSVAFYMAFGEGKVVLEGSHRMNFHINVFDAKTGKQAWQFVNRWPGKDHGKHIARPAIANGRLYVRPYILDLKSGEQLGYLPHGGRGCGTVALTDHVAITRMTNISLCDLTTRRVTGWHRLRPNCWISAIPAMGMILAPEGGGGCTCGGWIETSAAFKPRLEAIGFEGPDNFIDSAEIKISRPLGAAPVHYTLDGSAPTLKSKRYAAPISIAKDTTVRAAAVRPGRARTLGEVITKRVEKHRLSFPAECKINFQPRQRRWAVPKGYLADYGWPFKLRDGNTAFGWDKTMWNQVKGGGRDLVKEAFLIFRGGRTWEMRVENGQYDVTVGVSPGADGVFKSLKVCSVVLCKNRKLTGDPPQRITKRVTVRDGRITLGSEVKSFETVLGKIHYLEFKKR